MKRILITIVVLMLASLAWGQNNTEKWEGYYNFSDGLSKVVVGNDTINKPFTGVYQTMTIATLIQQWDQYSKECYADSTVKNFLKPLFDGDNGYYLPEFTHERWIHKQPSFLDFMLRLKKKAGMNMKKDSILYIK